jgi:hypothetical protein
LIWFGLAAGALVGVFFGLVFAGRASDQIG